MTKEKKICRDKFIQTLIYTFVIQRQAFDWWLEPWFFEDVARAANCSVHVVKRVFYKQLLPNDYEWFTNFTY